MSLIVCEDNNEITENILHILPTNQGGVGRHKCVVCAFQYGIEDGRLNTDKTEELNNIEICKHGSFAPVKRLDYIHDNQKHGEGRHKCLICAYHIGFSQSINLLNKSIQADSVDLGLLINRSSEVNANDINYRGRKKVSKVVKIDYIEEQRYKVELGLLGEKLVCKYEHEQGYKIKHVSLKDDSLGFDIETYANGLSKFIEVKTTTGNIDKPFYISKNELDFLKTHQDTAYIYRVYNYKFKTNSADLYIISAKEFLAVHELDCISYVTIGISKDTI